MVENSLEYTLEIVEVPNDAQKPELGNHRVELVRIKYPGIGVRAYKDHDEVLVPGSVSEPRVYCFAVYIGEGRTSGLSKKFIEHYNNDELDDLSAITNGRLSSNRLPEVRDLMRTLRDEGRLKRDGLVCSSKIRLEEHLKILSQLQPQKPL